MVRSSTSDGAMVVDRRQHYWPCEMLHAFTLEMAARGICVQEGMMLGDADYARQKLAQANALQDPVLNQLVLNMLGYFELGRQVG